MTISATHYRLLSFLQLAGAWLLVALLYATVILPTLPHWMLILAIGRVMGLTDRGYGEFAMWWLQLGFLSERRGD